MKEIAPRHRTRLIATLLTAAMLASACGGGDEAEETAAATATPEEAAEATATPAPQPEPTVGATAEPTAAPTVAPTPAPDPTADPTTSPGDGSSPLETWSWTRRTGAEAGFGDSVVSLNSVAFGADVFVAGGTLQGPGGDFVSAETWASSDGLSWTRAALPDEGGLDVQDVVFTDGRFFAVGRDTDGAAMWRSGDGSAWERVTPEQWSASFSPRAVTGGPTGLVVTGVTGRQRVEMWHSGDATTWTEAAVFEQPQGIWVDEIGSGADGYVAVGRQGEEADQRAAVFVSVDGLAWSGIPDEESLFPSSSSITSLTVSDELGYVAAGYDPSATGRTSLWTSDGGTEWIRSPVEGEPRAVSVRNVASAPSSSTTVAVGSGAPAAKVWLIAEGSEAAITLAALPEFDVIDDGTFAEGVAAAFGDDRLVVVGLTIADGTQLPAAWVATPSQ